MKPPWNQEAELATVDVPEDARAVELAPSAEPRTPGEWMRANLFSSPFNGIVTVVTIGLAGWLGYALFHWMFVTADWTVVRVNFRLSMIGRFPIDQAWRVWVATYYVALVAGLSWGRTGRRLVSSRTRIVRRVVLTVLGLLLFRFLVDSALVWGVTAGAAGTLVAGVLIGRAAGPGSRGMRRVVLLGWGLAFPFIIVILQAAGGVSPDRWGGFLLNVLVAVVGIALSFPFGILLALGRKSTFPAIRLVCVGFIEFVRGAPLYVWLIFGQYLLPFLLPPGIRLPGILRIMIVITFFSAAYVAEIVRGGLQGVSQGQFEAGRALGLSTIRLNALIVLPQALRNTIPAMISHFISLFKDTSLLAILGFIEVLRVARISSAAQQFVGTSKQTLLFSALIFWIVAFSMSRWSQRLEHRLGVGER